MFLACLGKVVRDRDAFVEDALRFAVLFWKFYLTRRTQLRLVSPDVPFHLMEELPKFLNSEDAEDLTTCQAAKIL